MNEEVRKTSNFQELGSWQQAHGFVLWVYRETKTFPKEELFGLTSQFRRAAVSITANIAEGYKKTGKADKLRFFNIAQGSLEECRYYLILSNDLEYIKKETFQDGTLLIETTSKLLNAYCKAIHNSLTS